MEALGSGILGLAFKAAGMNEKGLEASVLV